MPQTLPIALDTSRNVPNADWLTAAIKREAQRLGFVFCGIASIEGPPPHHAEFRQWLNDGCAADMAYLSRQEPKRADPNAVLPGIRSLVAVGLNYTPTPDTPHAMQGARGTIARYARFDDYHEIMWERLNALLAYILVRTPGSDGRAYCDTGPVTERDLAMQAGIGWIGKHTKLISRKLGNWFFLGELLLTAALTADTPETPHCGTCTRCIAACPTQAIVAPYRLDARRCISYLTIENKGPIPVALRPAIGARIYGCDDCLAVCPWNKFAVVSDDPAVQPRADLQSPELIPLLALSEQQFRDKFAGSPIKRAKRRGLARNICVALGNVGGADALPALYEARAADGDPMVREHAAWAVEQIERRGRA